MPKQPPACTGGFVLLRFWRRQKGAQIKQHGIEFQPGVALAGL